MNEYFTRLKINNVDALGELFRNRLKNGKISYLVTVNGPEFKDGKKTFEGKFNADGESSSKGLVVRSNEKTVSAAMNPKMGQPIRAYWQIFDAELPSRTEYDEDLKMNLDKGKRIWFGNVLTFFSTTAGSAWNSANIKNYTAFALPKVNQDNAKPSTVNISNPQGIIKIDAYHESFKEVSLSNEDRSKSVVQTVIGTMIVYVRNGSKLETFNVPYSSGRGTSDQTMPDAGPTPEGEYIVNPKAVQNMSMVDRLKDEKQNSDELAFHNLVKLTIADADYGIFRVKLDIDKSNPTTRHSMYIHGGKRMGSIGCLDVGKQQNWFYEQLRKSTHPFPVYVHWKEGFIYENNTKPNILKQ